MSNTLGQVSGVVMMILFAVWGWVIPALIMAVLVFGGPVIRTVRKVASGGTSGLKTLAKAVPWVLIIVGAALVIGFISVMDRFPFLCDLAGEYKKDLHSRAMVEGAHISRTVAVREMEAKSGVEIVLGKNTKLYSIGGGITKMTKAGPMRTTVFFEHPVKPSAPKGSVWVVEPRLGTQDSQTNFWYVEAYNVSDKAWNGYFEYREIRTEMARALAESEGPLLIGLDSDSTFRSPRVSSKSASSYNSEVFWEGWVEADMDTSGQVNMTETGVSMYHLEEVVITVESKDKAVIDSLVIRSGDGPAVQFDPRQNLGNRQWSAWIKFEDNGHPNTISARLNLGFKPNGTAVQSGTRHWVTCRKHNINKTMEERFFASK